MASKRHIRRKSCAGKVQHRDKAEAQAHLQSLWFKTRDKYNLYRCNFCGFWCVGHKKPFYSR